MFSYLYVACVAAVLLNFGTSTPIPQNTPIYVCPQGYHWYNGECNQITCPSTHYLQNGVCYLRVQNSQPTAVAPIPVAQPCPAASTSCATAVAPITVAQPCPAASTLCPTAVTPVPVTPCPAASTSCPTAVAPIPMVQPCPAASTSCPTAVAPIPVAQPCPAAIASCQTAVAPIPVAQPCPAAITSCQTAVAPIPVAQPCPAAITSCPTTVVPIPVPQPCPTPSCPTATNGQAPCPTACPSPCQSPPCPIPTSPPRPTPGPTPSPPTQPPPPPPTQPQPPPPTPSPTRPPRPEPIIRCPVGTILINGYCHLIYCGRGIYRNGKCIQTECPDGTVWTGSRCEVPTPHNHTTVYMTNVITTNVNQTDVNREINYTNNMAIYITESPIIIKAPPTPAPSSSPEPKPTTTNSPSTNCCIVVTPRKCVWEGDRYSCRSRKYRQCGSICTHGYIYLKPPTEVPPPPPPPPPPCAENNCGYDHEPFYPDCSSCNTAVDDNCSMYCERALCQTRRCHSVDLRGYCGNYPGSVGCRPVDGCTQDWCGVY